MDMSGSMRYDGQYINVKRMGLALDGLIRSEYPGDYIHFIEMYTFAKPCRSGQIIDLLPKPVTIHDPIDPYPHAETAQASSSFGGNPSEPAPKTRPNQLEPR